MSQSVLAPALTADDIPNLIQRLESGSSLEQLAQELGVSRESLRKKIKVWCYTYSGTNELYQDLITRSMGERLVEAEDAHEASLSRGAIAVAHARDSLAHVRWMLERRVNKLYGPKQQIQQDTSISITIQELTPQPVVVEPQIIDATSDHAPK